MKHWVDLYQKTVKTLETAFVIYFNVILVIKLVRL